MPVSPLGEGTGMGGFSARKGRKTHGDLREISLPGVPDPSGDTRANHLSGWSSERGPGGPGVWCLVGPDLVFGGFFEENKVWNWVEVRKRPCLGV